MSTLVHPHTNYSFMKCWFCALNKILECSGLLIFKGPIWYSVNIKVQKFDHSGTCSVCIKQKTVSVFLFLFFFLNTFNITLLLFYQSYKWVPSFLYFCLVLEVNFYTYSFHSCFSLSHQTQAVCPTLVGMINSLLYLLLLICTLLCKEQLVLGIQDHLPFSEYSV